MPVPEIARAMRSRVPWRVASKMFQLSNVPRGHGWDATLEKIGDEDGSAEQQETLLNLYKEHLICGEKSVRFYRLRRPEMDELHDQFTEAEIQENDFSRAYPMPVDTDAIAEIPVARPVLVAVEERQDGMAAMYSSVRETEVRITVDPENLPEGAQEALEDYNEIILVSRQKSQAFDTVWIPRRGTRIDVRTDLPVGATHDTSVLAQEAIRVNLENLLERQLGAPLNLFPLINRIYRADDEGTVVELAFVTDTASWKHEKMRRRHLCLRTELYHVGGTDAVDGAIEPFKLGVEWELPLLGRRTSTPELILHSTARMLHTNNPHLYEATIRKCTGLGDFETVRRKVLQHLGARR